jgi:hypothetical protein
MLAASIIFVYFHASFAFSIPFYNRESGCIFFEWIRRDEHSVALTYHRSIYISIQCQHTRPNSFPSTFPDIVVPKFDHFTRKIFSLLSGIKAYLIFNMHSKYKTYNACD